MTSETTVTVHFVAETRQFRREMRKVRRDIRAVRRATLGRTCAVVLALSAVWFAAGFVVAGVMAR